jgi:hypothetical protein
MLSWSHRLHSIVPVKRGEHTCSAIIVEIGTRRLDACHGPRCEMRLTGFSKPLRY